MKIILDNIVFSLQKYGGISRYWFELVSRLADLSQKVEFIEQPEDHGNLYRKQLNLKDCHIIVQNRIPPPLARYLPIYAKVDGPAIFHSSYFRTCHRRDVFNIITLYDFIYERFDTGLRKHVHILQKRYAIRHADGIICISKSCRNDLHEFYPGVRDDRVKVINIGAGEIFHPIDKHKHLSSVKNLEYPYVLYVGRRVGYKNFDMAVDVVSRMDDRWLVIAGGGDLNARERKLLEDKLGKRYVYAKSPSDLEMNLLYNFAQCMLYPSSYEGFGIPVVEAMRAGCPVITTSEGSLPEVAGHAGLTADRIESEAFLDQIALLENPSVRNRVIQAGFKQARQFTWERCFTETIAFYNQIAK